MRRNIALIIGSVFIIGGIAGWAAAMTKRSVFNRVVFESATGGGAIGDQISFENGFVPVAKRVLPAVVNIASSRMVRTSTQGPGSILSDPFFQQFFGGQFRVPREQREHSLGSGVILNTGGYVLTNNHVVSGSDVIDVSLADKRTFKGRIVGTDAKTDIAVVKIEGNDLPVLSLGDSSKVQVGDFALAVGNPFGIGETMTMGIISATGRSGLGIEDYEDFIQTDAAINPGNSGGALVNVRGDLIGLNTAIITGNGGGGSQGVGFAVPVNMVRNVMDQILKNGKVVRGSLGVMIQSVTPEIAKSFGLTGQQRGALIANVEDNSPAAKAGLKRGDIITEVNGQPIATSSDLSLKLSMLAPGTAVKLKVFRDGHEQDVNATLEELSNQQRAAANQGETQGSSSGTKLGITVEPVSPQIAAQLNLPARTPGLVITNVEPGSAAEEAGLRQGDVIQEVNRKSISDPSQFRDALKQANGQPVLLLIDRGGNHAYVTVGAQ